MAAPRNAGGGNLRHRIAFDQRSDVGDDYGGTESEFVEQFIVSAGVEARLGGEQVMAARLTGRQPVTITVRQSEQTRRIETGWRARDVRTEVTYAIRSIVDPDDRRQYLEILCETGAEA